METNKKPTVKLIGTDGNAFALIGRVCAGLRKEGMFEEAKEFQRDAMSCGSYEALLVLCVEVCNVV